MGNDQSRASQQGGEQSRTVDYYELLQVSEGATDDEIRASVPLTETRFLLG